MNRHHATVSFATIILLAFLAACGGGGENGSGTATGPDTNSGADPSPSPGGTPAPSPSPGPTPSPGTDTPPPDADPEPIPAPGDSGGFAAQIAVAPAANANVSGVIRLEIQGSGIRNAELLPATGYAPVYVRFTVASDGTRATADFDTRALPDGAVTLRISAFNTAPGEPGASEIVAMSSRTWIVSNGGAGLPPPVAGADARFRAPYGIAADGSGNLYVTDAGNNTIRRITADGRVSTIAGTAGSSGTNDGAGAAARFTNLTGITADSAGNIYVLDGHAVRRIAPNGAVSTVAGVVTERGWADRPGREALFNNPRGIIIGPSNMLLVADSGNGAIRSITPAGEVGTAGEYAHDSMLSMTNRNASGMLYLGGENTWWRMDYSSQHGIVGSALRGGAVGEYGNVDGCCGAARFWPIRGITVDASGNVYAATAFLFPRGQGTVAHIRRMTPRDSNALEFTASTLDLRNPDGSSKTLQFPTGIVAHPDGNLYLADPGNHVIYRVTPSGIVTVFAGREGEAGSR